MPLTRAAYDRSAASTTLAISIARVMGPVPPGMGAIHPATRTFQALRILVNEELTALRQVVINALGLKRGDRVAGIFAQKWLAGTPGKAELRSTLGGPLDGMIADYQKKYAAYTGANSTASAVRMYLYLVSLPTLPGNSGRWLS